MLMREAVVMVSVMPFTNWPTSSLATPSACCSGRSPATLDSLVLSMATTVSQYWRRTFSAFFALSYLNLSTENGRVTTPITRRPCFFSSLESTSTAPCAQEDDVAVLCFLLEVLKRLPCRCRTALRVPSGTLAVRELLTD